MCFLSGGRGDRRSAGSPGKGVSAKEMMLSGQRQLQLFWSNWYFMTNPCVSQEKHDSDLSFEDV